MELEQAIETLEDTADESWVKYNPTMQNALKLGIEALKQIKSDRFIAHPYCLNSLPGETKE